MRTLLAWVLIFAVHAQGFAAVTMALCGPNHHGMSASMHDGSMAPAEHAPSQLHARATHADHEQAALPVVNATDAGGSDATSTSIHGEKQKCSACASCCSVGAMLTTVLAVPAPDLTPTLFTLTVAAIDAFAVDGPDRPPRIALA